jgi:hypothetical protein
MNGWKIATLVSIGLLGVTLGSGRLPMASAEPQPRLEAALRHLHEAREELRGAAEARGGHREKALEWTERAIDQVEEGIRFARERHRR